MRKVFYLSVSDSRPPELSRRMMPIYCQAANRNGAPCQCHALRGEAFCHSHLRQGYGLFTLAAVEAYKLRN
jgi:hypothetical protein